MLAAGLIFWTCNILTVRFDFLWPWVGVFKSPNIPINEAISLHPWGFLEGLGDSLYYSVITFTTLGFGDLHPAGLTMKLLSGIESAVGALFVALIIVVFARKWMRG